jgi:stage II sporulation SpoAA-like protein
MDSSPDSRSAMALRLDEQGVLRLTWAKRLRITAELADTAVGLVEELSAGRRLPLLVEMSGTAGATREARTLLVRRCPVRRLALLGTSAVDRVLANFALGAPAVPVPIRYFTSESAALAWLTTADQADGDGR